MNFNVTQILQINFGHVVGQRTLDPPRPCRGGDPWLGDSGGKALAYSKSSMTQAAWGWKDGRHLADPPLQVKSMTGVEWLLLSAAKAAPS